LETSGTDVPDSCTRLGSSTRFIADGTTYYSAFCQTAIHTPTEERIRDQYTHWCTSEPHQAYVDAAAEALHNSDSLVNTDSWRTYLDAFCGAIPNDDIYRYYTPNQSLGATLVKSDEFPAVYAVLSDGKRHAFPTEAVYKSWFGDDFSQVQTISSEALALYTLGTNVTFHPGTLIKIPSIPNVYMISDDNELRWLSNEETAQTLYGETWNKQIYDVSEGLFMNYEGEGDDIAL
ncbi:MAG: hypothetical protein AAB276_03235, partial [Pseudomonadota bacterium]